MTVVVSHNTPDDDNGIEIIHCVQPAIASPLQPPPMEIEEASQDMDEPTQSPQQSIPTTFLSYLTTHQSLIALVHTRCLIYSFLLTLIVLAVTLPILLYALIPYHITFQGSDASQLNTTWDQVRYIVLLRLPNLMLPWGFPSVITATIMWFEPRSQSVQRKQSIWRGAMVMAMIVDAVLSCLALYNRGTRIFGRVVGVMNMIFQFMFLYYPYKENYPERSKWYHHLFCGSALTLEIVFSVIIVDLPQFLRSEIFQLLSPFIFSLTAMLSRKAAQMSTYSMHTASKVSTASLGFSHIFIRAAHVASQADPTRMVLLELLYFATSLVTRTTLYYRHAVINKVLSGKCELVVKHSDERGRYITAHSNIADAIFEMTSFAVSWSLRYALRPSDLPVGDFVWIFVVCGLIQSFGNVVVVGLTGFMERVDFRKVIPAFVENMGEFQYHMFYYSYSYVCGYVYLLYVLLPMWDSKARSEFLGSL